MHHNSRSLNNICSLDERWCKNFKPHLIYLQFGNVRWLCSPAVVCSFQERCSPSTSDRTGAQNPQQGTKPTCPSVQEKQTWKRERWSYSSAFPVLEIFIILWNRCKTWSDKTWNNDHTFQKDWKNSNGLRSYIEKEPTAKPSTIIHPGLHRLYFILAGQRLSYHTLPQCLAPGRVREILRHRTWVLSLSTIHIESRLLVLLGPKDYQIPPKEFLNRPVQRLLCFRQIHPLALLNY